MSNLDLNAAKRIIYMLSNFYPERMGQCLIVSAPMVFSAVWAVIRPWLSRRTQTKVQFCKAEELGRWIAPAALPSFWGGLDQTVYSARYVALSLACMSGLPFKLGVLPPTPWLMLQSPHSHQRSQASCCCQLSRCQLSSLSRFNCCHVGCVACMPPCRLPSRRYPHSRRVFVCVWVDAWISCERKQGCGPRCSANGIVKGQARGG